MNIALPDIRKLIGMSGMALAARAGISRWRLTQAELGNLTLTEAEQEKIAQALMAYSQQKIDDLTRLGITGYTAVASQS